MYTTGGVFMLRERPTSIQFFSTDGRAILVLHADGRVTWTGEQTDVARRFWQLVEEMCPWHHQRYRAVVEALRALVAETERCDNPSDEGVGRDDDVMIAARKALADAAS